MSAKSPGGAVLIGRGEWSTNVQPREQGGSFSLVVDASNATSRHAVATRAVCSPRSGSNKCFDISSRYGLPGPFKDSERGEPLGGARHREKGHQELDGCCIESAAGRERLEEEDGIVGPSDLGIDKAENRSRTGEQESVDANHKVRITVVRQKPRMLVICSSYVVKRVT